MMVGRMRADRFPGRGAERGKRAPAVTDDHLARDGVDAAIVGIVAERQHREGRDIAAAIEAQRAVAGTGHVERVGRRDVADALWLLETADPVQDSARREIDDADAVIAELGEEEAAMREG